MKRKRPTKAAKAASKGKAAELASLPPPSQAQLERAYRSGYIDGIAFAKAKRASKQFNASRTGLDAARVALMEEEAGVDIAADIAEKAFPSPKKNTAKNRNLDLARFRLSQGLEDLGWWLVEAIPCKGGKKARWKKILPIAPQGKPGFFTPQHRYTLTPGGKRQREKSPIRQTISKTASKKLLCHLRTKLDKAQADGDERISPLLKLMEEEEAQAAIVHFLTLFHQRCSGTRREVLERRQRLAEADAHGIERPRKIGDTKEKASKTQENDIAWIRAQRRTS